MAAIRLERVSKIFPNGHAAARDLTLDVVDGELLVLVGPSGSGKSTVLRLVAGLEAPTEGRILIGGRDVTALPPQRRDLAMVFQSYALYPHKTVRGNLAFGLQVRQAGAAEIAARVQRTAASLGLEALLDRKPAQLSGGQRQRVALGRAIVREPQAFLLDEPLSNLDPLLRVSTRAELALLHRTLAATMVYVTHDQEEAMTLGSRVAVMRDGRIEQLAPGLDLFRRPANVFVARFIGSPAMNLWRCVAGGGGRNRLACSAFAIDLPPGQRNPGDGAAVTLGARPHDIDLLAAGEGDGAGRVEIVEALGPLTLVHLRPDGQPEELVRVAVPSDARVRVDDRCGFRLRRDRLHVFDAETEERIDS